MKRQPIEWEKILANEITNKVGYIQYFGDQYQKNNISSISKTAQYQKNKWLNQKMGRRSKYLFPARRHSRRHSFPPRKTYFPQKHMKRYSTLLIIREMQIKTITRYYLISVRMVIIKKYANNTCWRGCGEKGTLKHVVGM